MCRGLWTYLYIITALNWCDLAIPFRPVLFKICSIVLKMPSDLIFKYYIEQIYLAALLTVWIEILGLYFLQYNNNNAVWKSIVESCHLNARIMFLCCCPHWYPRSFRLFTVAHDWWHMFYLIFLTLIYLFGCRIIMFGLVFWLCVLYSALVCP